MPLSGKAMLLASSLGVAVALAGCGSSGGRLLSQPAATQLSAELTQASSALANYDCAAASTAISEFHNDVAQLQGVDSTLVTMLSQGASTISSLADQRCPQTTTATRTTPTVTTHTTRTTTTTTTPATTTTVAPPVTTTSTGSGGAAPTTLSTPATTSTPTVATQPPPSGGAGLSQGGGSGAPGSAG